MNNWRNKVKQRGVYYEKITILFFSILLMLSLNTNIYASESMYSNEYSIIETFSDGSYIKSVLIDD